MSILSRINEYFFRRNELRKWRKKNTHNFTTMANHFDQQRVTVGKYTYGSLFVLMHNSNQRVSIGNFCSIAPNVCFIVESDHETKNVSTYPFKAKCLGECSEAISKGDIIVKDDVWIGYGSTILSGVTINQGAVIAANSLVNRNVPPYAIVAGIPAKVIKYRFSEHIINVLNTIDYTRLDIEKIDKLKSELYTTLDEDNVEQIVNKINS